MLIEIRISKIVVTGTGLAGLFEAKLSSTLIVGAGSTENTIAPKQTDTKEPIRFSAQRGRDIRNPIPHKIAPHGIEPFGLNGDDAGQIIVG